MSNNNAKTLNPGAGKTPDNKDAVWVQIRKDAVAMASEDEAMADFIANVVLVYDSLEAVIGNYLAHKLDNKDMPADRLQKVFQEAFEADETIGTSMREDILATHDRDPACKSQLDPVLFFKGFLALQTYRVAHWLIVHGRRGMALYLQNRASDVFGADIHPAARIGHGIMIDHATGVVIGETAVVGNDVSMLHGVTLGGSGKEGGDRHPKIGDGVLISVGAKVLGNIHVGDCAKIGGGSVVLTDVPAYSTAVGVPAKIVGKVSTPEPSREMDHSFEGADSKSADDGEFSDE